MILYQNVHLNYSGFSTVLLVEDNTTRRKYAIKKIVCHGPEDQHIAVKEIEYHSLVKHPNVIECIDSTHKGTADPVVNATSEVLLVLPYYYVSLYYLLKIYYYIFTISYYFFNLSIERYISA